MRKQNLPEVLKITKPGFDQQTGCWIFHDVVVDREGTHHPLPAKAEFWQVGGQNIMLKPPPEERHVPRRVAEGPLDLCWLLTNIEAAWGLHGVATLGFFAATLFANQFAAKLGWFPLLSLWGPAGPGKTSLINVLQTCLGRARLGSWGPTKHSTQAAYHRLLGEVSSLPVVISEFNEKAAEKYGIDSLKGLFNRAPVATRAARNHGLETYAVPFLAAVVFEWNEQFFPDAALASRVASLLFPERDSKKSLAPFQAISAADPGLLADFRHQILRHPKWFLERLFILTREEAAWLYKQGFVEDNAGERLVQVYGVPMGGALCVAEMAVEARTMSETALGELRGRLRELMAREAARAVRSFSSASTVLELWFDTVGADLNSGSLSDFNPRSDDNGEVWLSSALLRAKYAPPAWNFVELLKEASEQGHLLHAPKSESKYCNPDSEKFASQSCRVFRFRREAFFPTHSETTT